MNLNEHGPKDLLKLYSDAFKNDVDIENSEFKEISKEEALQFIKNKNADWLHLIIHDKDSIQPDKVVTLKPNGSANETYFIVDRDKIYVKKTGSTESRMNKMPGSHLVKIADKIYLTSLTPKDKDKQQARLANNDLKPAMQHKNDWVGRRARGYAYDYNAPVREIQAYPNDALYRMSVNKTVKAETAEEVAAITRRIENIKLRIEQTKDDLESTNDPITKRIDQERIDDLESALHSYEDRLTNLQRDERTLINLSKDAKAAVRYVRSADNLQSNLLAKMKQLDKIDRLQRNLQRTANELDNVKQFGSEKTRDSRLRLQRAETRLDYYLDQAAELERILQDTSVNDERALQDAMEQYNEIVKESEETQQLINDLLKIKQKRGG